MNRLLSTLLITALLAAPATAAEPAKVPAKGDPVPGQYIVVLAKTGLLGGILSAKEITSIGQELVKKHGGSLLLSYGSALNGYLVRLDEKQAAALGKDPAVKYLEQDSFAGFARTQSEPVWGLDRLDQRKRPVDGYFRYPDSAGRDVNVYVLDTGIRSSHEDFKGRYKGGVNFAGGAGNDPSKSKAGDVADCNGHGTHVAGTIAGERYGVAKRTNLYAVRVLDCVGSGTSSGVIAGLDWVAKNARRPAVANLSLGGGASRALDDAINQLVSNGIVTVVAAGNDNRDACSSSPARVPDAITVAATDEKDRRAAFSNYGKCVDLFAPGVNIRSDWFEKDNQYATLSGTSMAAPHVAGIAALYLSEHPNWRMSELSRELGNDASRDKLGDLKGSPDRLAYSGRIKDGDSGGSPGDSQPQPQPDIFDQLPRLPLGR